MKTRHWNTLTSQYVVDVKTDQFIEEILAVCRKHDLSISHEDGHGAFEIVLFDDHYSEWLRGAHIEKEEQANAVSS